MVKSARQVVEASRLIFSRGNSEHRRAAHQLTAGKGNFSESVTEKETAKIFGKDEKAGQAPTGRAVMFVPDKPCAVQSHIGNGLKVVPLTFRVESEELCSDVQSR